MPPMWYRSSHTLVVLAPRGVRGVRTAFRARRAGGLLARRLHAQLHRHRADLRPDAGGRALSHVARPAVDGPHLDRRGPEWLYPPPLLPIREGPLARARSPLPSPPPRGYSL